VTNISKLPKRYRWALYCIAFIVVFSISVFGLITQGTLLINNIVMFGVLYVLILLAQLIGEYYKKRSITKLRFHNIIFMSFVYLWAMIISTCIYHLLGVKMEPSP